MNPLLNLSVADINTNNRPQWTDNHPYICINFKNNTLHAINTCCGGLVEKKRRVQNLFLPAFDHFFPCWIEHRLCSCYEKRLVVARSNWRGGEKR